MDKNEKNIVSIYMDNPNAWERLFKKHKGPIYVVERTFMGGAYGETFDRRKRRYTTLFLANKRLEYEVMKHPEVHKAYLFSFPLDLVDIRAKLKAANGPI